MKEERKTIQIEDAVYLTDPCYDITTWCQDLLHNVKSGTWVIDYEYNEYENGTGQEVIYNIKIRYFNEGNLDWQVDDILADKELEQFDWFKLPSDCYDYIEV